MINYSKKLVLNQNFLYKGFPKRNFNGIFEKPTQSLITHLGILAMTV